jgi:N-methylhydantoinase A
MIARELGISSLLVPGAASILCAVGMLLSDLQHDFVRSYVVAFSRIDLDRLRSLVDSMVARGGEELRREGVPEKQASHQVLLDMRYVKQYHEVTVPVSRETLDRGDLDRVATAFHAEHDRLYGYELAEEGTDLELISVRVRSLGRTEKPELPLVEEGGEDPGGARKGSRRAFVPEREAFADLPVYDGHRLRAGNVVPGPALLERVDTTVLVTAGFAARVDGRGTYVLEANGGRT